MALIPRKSWRSWRSWRLGGSFSFAGTAAVAGAIIGCGENTDRVVVPATSSTSDAGQVMGAIGSPIGFAAVAAGTVQTTTGGGVRVADFASTCSDLKALLEDADHPRVIVVTQAIDCHREPEPVDTCERDCDAATNDPNRKVYRVMPPDAADCSQVSGGSASDPIVSKTRNETIINVTSDKTLIGQGSGAAVAGANLYIRGQSNVIIQNLMLRDVNPDLLEAGDAITIDGSNHIWVDHCAFSNISDGFVDAIKTSSDITLSWNKFEGANPDACAGQHNYAHTIDGASVTFHHDMYDHTLAYSPKISNGSHTHFFNDYWLNVLVYCIQVASESQALIQGNDFEDSKNPYQISGSCFDDATPCGISAPADTPNLFEGISASETHVTGGIVDPLPYDPSTYQVEDASAAKRAVIANAGNTL